MEFLEWNDKKMSIGIILIDDQHKELLRIINQLSTSINEQSQRRDVLMIVDELINYADYHFTTEEELFDKLNYSETEIHKKEHQEFVDKFISMKDKISNNESFLRKNAIEIAQDIFKYIINWFLAHIVGSDRKYIDLFKANQIQ